MTRDLQKLKKKQDLSNLSVSNVENKVVITTL